MIEQMELQDKVGEYVEVCRRSHREPTRKGLGEYLGISGTTIANVVRGYFNGGRKYTEKPHPTRCIDNSDFMIIRELFTGV